MGGPVGMHFHGTAIAYLEHNARFLAPVRPGDTLDHRVDDRARSTPSPRTAAASPELAGTATNQDGVVAARATGKIMVYRAALTSASARTHSATSAGPR